MLIVDNIFVYVQELLKQLDSDIGRWRQYKKRKERGEGKENRGEQRCPLLWARERRKRKKYKQKKEKKKRRKGPIGKEGEKRRRRRRRGENKQDSCLAKKEFVDKADQLLIREIDRLWWYAHTKKSAQSRIIFQNGPKIPGKEM